MVQLRQRQHLADDNYFVTGLRKKRPAGRKRKQISPKAGERAWAPGRKGAGCRHSLPTRLPLPPGGLGRTGQELLGCKNENIKRIVPDKRQYNRH